MATDPEVPTKATDSAREQLWLEGFVTRHGGVAGTVHVRQDPEYLELRAAFRIPPKVLEKVAQIPRGKGMAGLAWERGEAVSTCNLKTDTTGDVRPGAKAVDAQAAVALPVYRAPGDLRAVVGVAYTEERTLSEAELAELLADASTLP